MASPFWVVSFVGMVGRVRFCTTSRIFDWLLTHILTYIHDKYHMIHNWTYHVTLDQWWTRLHISNLVWTILTIIRRKQEEKKKKHTDLVLLYIFSGSSTRPAMDAKLSESWSFHFSTRSMASLFLKEYANSCNVKQ